MNVKNAVNENKMPHFSIPHFSKARPESSYPPCPQVPSLRPCCRSSAPTRLRTSLVKVSADSMALSTVLPTSPDLSAAFGPVSLSLPETQSSLGL